MADSLLSSSSPQFSPGEKMSDVEEERIEKIFFRRSALIGSDERVCDIVVKHSQVATQHTRVTRENDSFSIIDLDSATGTFVGDERLVPLKPHELHEGTYCFHFVFESHENNSVQKRVRFFQNAKISTHLFPLSKAGASDWVAPSFILCFSGWERQFRPCRKPLPNLSPRQLS